MKPIHCVLATLALMVGTAAPPAVAQSEAARLRAEIETLRDTFELKLAALEQRLQTLEAGPSPGPVVERLGALEGRLAQVESEARAAPSTAATQNAFNPQISLILGGSYGLLDADPESYRLQGFIPGGEETGPAPRSFKLSESELVLSANIDPLFYGQATFAVTAESEIEVEEAFVRSSALPHGLSAQFGRFFSALGYVNGQHAHAWDFVDLPLAYDAMLGGQYRSDGLRLAWLAPLEQYLELGAELDAGKVFPGAEHGGNGFEALTLYASSGGDIGYSGSWKATLAWHGSDVEGREYEELDAVDGEPAYPTVFSGDSSLWSLAGVYKWAPGGNARERNLKLQGEYFWRDEDGTLEQDHAELGAGRFDYDARQSGWYLQGVYQWRRAWRAGLRLDRLDSGDVDLAVLDGALSRSTLPSLGSYDPQRLSLMLDYSPTEFSRLRLQFARDESMPGGSDGQVYLQYLMSLGAHGGHKF